MSKTIKDAIKQLAGDKQQEIYSLVAKVSKVDADERTCEVVPIDDPDDIIFGVRLQSVLNGSTGFVIVPKVDSEVIVTFLNPSTGYVALVAEVEKLELVVGDKKLTHTDQGIEIASNLNVKDGNNELDLDQQGIKIGNSTASLKSILTDILVQLSSFKVQVVGVVGTVEPSHVAQFQIIQGQLNSFLK